MRRVVKFPNDNHNVEMIYPNDSQTVGARRVRKELNAKQAGRNPVRQEWAIVVKQQNREKRIANNSTRVIVPIKTRQTEKSPGNDKRAFLVGVEPIAVVQCLVVPRQIVVQQGTAVSEATVVEACLAAQVAVKDVKPKILRLCVTGDNNEQIYQVI